MELKQLSVNGRRLSYRSTGEGRPPVVLVHGFGEDSRVWDPILPFLSSYHLIVPDLPGSGASESSENMSMEGLAEDLQKLVVHETATLFFKAGEPGSVAMIGHSMGGYITLAFAEKWGAALRGFGLFHSSAFADTEEKKDTRRKGISFIRENGIDAFLRTSTPKLYSQHTHDTAPHIPKLHIESLGAYKAESAIRYYKAMMARPDRTEVLRNSEVPVLFIIGMHDTAVLPEDAMKQVHLPATSAVHFLQHSGHMGMQEETEAAGQYLGDFLRFVFENRLSPADKTDRQP